MRARLTALLGDERVRFVITGGLNTLVGYGFFVLVQASIGHVVGYLASLVIAHLLASTIAFTVYRRFVFKVHGHLVRDFLRFQSVYVVPLLANLVLLPLVVELLGWNVYVAQAVVVLVSTLISYVGHKYFSFRRSAVADDTAADGLPGDDDLEKDA
jgi:putative flippase GtrA